MSNVNGESDVSPTEPETIRTVGNAPHGNRETPGSSVSSKADRSEGRPAMAVPTARNSNQWDDEEALAERVIPCAVDPFRSRIRKNSDLRLIVRSLTTSATSKNASIKRVNGEVWYLVSTARNRRTAPSSRSCRGSTCRYSWNRRHLNSHWLPSESTKRPDHSPSSSNFKVNFPLIPVRSFFVPLSMARKSSIRRKVVFSLKPVFTPINWSNSLPRSPL